MEAVICVFGYAVKTSNLSKTELCTAGYLIGFEYDGVAYELYLNSDYFMDDSKKPRLGYYKVSDYRSFISNTLTKSGLESLAFPHFLRATGEEHITFRKPYYKEVDGTYRFYSFQQYTAKAFEKDTYFFKSGKLQDDLFEIKGPFVSGGSSPGKEFFGNHVNLASSISDEDEKESFVKYTVSCALWMNMIFGFAKETIQKNLTGQDASDMIDLWDDIESHWKITIFVTEPSVQYMKDFRTALVNFYRNISVNQVVLESKSLDERKEFMLAIMSHGVLESLSASTRIEYVKSAREKYRSSDSEELKKEAVETILKLMDSISSTNQTEIDNFLDMLVSPDHAVAASKPAWNLEETGFVKREKITLFEAIADDLYSGKLLERIWDYSPAGKRINAAWGLSEAHTPLTAFMVKVYTLWVQSKYNPVRYDVFNQNYYGFENQSPSGKTFETYSHRTATEFQGAVTSGPLMTFDRSIGPPVIYVTDQFNHHTGRIYDSSKAQFEDFDRVGIYTTDIGLIDGDPSIGLEHMLKTTGYFIPVGFYHMYQAIQIIEVHGLKEYSAMTHSWTDGSLDYDQVCIPSFFWLFMDTIQDQKEIIETLWAVFIEAVENSAELLKAKKVKKFLDNVEDIVSVIEAIGNVVVDKTEVDFIKDYADGCTNSDEFCKKINTLSFWLVSHALVPNDIVLGNVQKASKAVVDYASANSWPTEFLTGSGSDARTLIIDLSAATYSYSEYDRVQTILDAIYEKIEREEPQSSTGDGSNFSLYKWQKNGNQYTRTTQRQLSETEMIDLIEHGLDQSVLPYSWITGIIFKAFRIKKPQDYTEVETALTNAGNFIKPVAVGGRGNVHYCFHGSTQKDTYEDILLSNYINRYSLEKHIVRGDKYNTYYGGSVHTKTLPPDVDMVSYISDAQMIAIYEQQIAVLEKARDLRIISRMEYSNRLKRLKKSFEKNGRITQAHIYAIQQNLLYIMKNEYKRFTTTINGQQVNLLESEFINEPQQLTDPDRLHLVPSTERGGKLDFVFFTYTDAENGRSIQPETLATFE